MTEKRSNIRCNQSFVPEEPVSRVQRDDGKLRRNCQSPPPSPEVPIPYLVTRQTRRHREFKQGRRVRKHWAGFKGLQKDDLRRTKVRIDHHLQQGSVCQAKKHFPLRCMMVQFDS